MRASTSPSPNTALVCGPIRSAGFPRSRAYRGQLAFLTNSFLLTLCAPEESVIAATDRLLRPAFGLYKLEWPSDPGVEFHLAHGDWISLLRGTGFEIEDLTEIRPDARAT